MHQGSELRRAMAYVVPTGGGLRSLSRWSGVSTALSLSLPYLSKTLIDAALVGRNPGALYRTVALFALASAAGFVLTAMTGLRYTRVSADVLFDMRLALYRHLQKLSPRFYARTPLGDILARVNNDVGEVQRVAAESLLAWVGNILFLAGSIIAMFWLDARLAAIALAMVPVSIWALSRVRTELAARVKAVREASAAIGSFLIETLQGVRLVVTSNAQQREVGTLSQAQCGVRRRADGDAALVLPVRQRARAAALARLRRRVHLRRPPRNWRFADARDVRRLHGLPDAPAATGAGADGSVCEPRDGAGLVEPRPRAARSAARRRRAR